MAIAEFIQDGDYIDYTPGSDVAAGDVVVLNDLIGVAKAAIKANRLGALAVTGVFDFPKQTGYSVALGQNTYWDIGQAMADQWSSSGTQLFLGKAVKAAASNATKVRVRINQ